MDLELNNKRVLVTGASRGIGFEIAKHFLQEGAMVAISSRGQERLTKAANELASVYGEKRIWSCSCDFTDTESVTSLASKIDALWGGIDIVVSNVGDGRSVPDPLPEAKQWQKVWDSNFETALSTARVFLPRLTTTTGCLLFVSSITGLESFGAPVDYSTAKAAVCALAKNISRKLGEKVRVNVLAPGNVYFKGGVWDEKIKQDSDRVSSIIKTTVPMNRFGTPAEMADAALFLCSERASFITGAVLVVDGGQTVGIL